VIRRAGSVFVQVCLLLVFVAPSAWAAERYVALGDSYSSGTGTRDYGLDEGCERSRYAYPALVAAQRPRVKLVFAACAGATISDVLATQVSRLNRTTRWVTITIGGNDVGFTRVISTCAQPDSSARCRSAIDRARSVIRDRLPAKLDTIYRKIRARAPDATVIVLGYPRLFTRENCDTRTSFSRATLSAVNQTAVLLSHTIRDRVTSAGGNVRFRDAARAFNGHEICARSPWLNGLISPIGDSYHPNRSGQRHGYTPLVLRAMTATA